jgi:5-methylcytosine-specific restriction enzyme A
MPHRLRTPCTYGGCDQLTDGGRCAEHKRKAEQQRGTSTQRGYGRQHQDRFRKAVLARDVVCRICHAALATHADHYPMSRRQLTDAGLDANDPRYGRGLCASCDSTQTTQRQPGGINQPR